MDLVISSPDLALQIFTQTELDTLGSDHFPVVGKIQFDLLRNVDIPHKENRFNYRKANWIQFQDHIKNCFDLGLVSSYEDLVNTISEARFQSIPVFKAVSSGYTGCPWWDEECSKMVRIRKFVLKEYLRNSSRINYLVLKRHMALAKKFLLKKKRESFRKYCEELSSDTSLSSVWRYIRKFGRRCNNSIQIAPVEHWTQEFFNRLTPAYVRNLDEIDPIPLSFSEDEVAQEISLDELKSALKSTGDGCPGSDDISFLMLRYIPNEALTYLVKLFNNILKGSNIPDDWFKVVVAPIPKPGRDSSSADGYRPI